MENRTTMLSAELNREKRMQIGREVLASCPSLGEVVDVFRFVSPLRYEAWMLLRELNPSADVLVTVIRLGGAPEQAEAWLKLTASSPSNEQLRLLVKAEVPQALMAGEMLLERCAQPDDLQVVVYHLSKLRERAARLLLTKYPTRDTLLFLVTCDALGQEPWQRLRALEPTSEELRVLVVHAETLREEIGCMLLESDAPSILDLLAVIRWVPALRHEAWKMLLAAAPGNEALTEVVRFGGELRELAGRMVLEARPVRDHLRVIMRCVPSLRPEAEALFG